MDKPRDETVNVCKCPYCDTEIVKEEAIFCSPCELTLIECVHCGEPIRVEIEVCPHCGESVS